MKSIICILFSAVTVHVVNAQGTPCVVCGEGKVVTNPDVIWQLPGQPAVACGLLETAGSQGLIPDSFCAGIPMLIANDCGCEPSSSSGTAAGGTTTPDENSTPGNEISTPSSENNNNDFSLDLGNKRLEGTHSLTDEDITQLGITGGSGKFVLVAEFFYGGVHLVDVEEQTSKYIVPSSANISRGGLGVTVSNGHIFVAAGGPLLGLPFEIYVYNSQGELVTTCSPASDVTAGLFNDFAVVGDVAYVTDSLLPRLWNFKISDAIAGNCVLEYKELEDVFDPAVQETLIESNGIVSVGDGFIISLFGGGGLYYVNPATDVSAEVVPRGTFGQPDGLEIVEEEDGTSSLYVTVGVSNNLFVYKIASQDGSEVPEASFVGTIESEKYDTPATSAILGENIYTANLRGAELPLLESGEDDLDTFNESFTLVKISRLTLSTEVPTLPDIPQTAIANGSFETLVVALSAADLVGAVSAPAGPFTVFAPTDDAFAALPDVLVECLLKEENVAVLSDILLYHVVSGEVRSTDLVDGMTATTLNGNDVTVDLSDGVKIDSSTVIIPDVEASNGVIHVIDSVLVPADIDVAGFLTSCFSVPTSMAPVFVDPALPDIPQTAIDNGSFKTLVAALTAADLVGALSEPKGPFTVFAPTDDAFAALPDGLVDCLVKEENVAVLSDILLHHVVSGEVRSTRLTNGMVYYTLNGDMDDLIVDLSDGVKINDSTVILPDVEASNGIIHVIDSVLVPDDVDVAAFLETCTAVPVSTPAPTMAVVPATPSPVSTAPISSPTEPSTTSAGVTITTTTAIISFSLFHMLYFFLQ